MNDDPMVVDRWLARRTSSIADWQAISLAGLKGDTKVAIVMPALNEAATVGHIVAAIIAEHTDGAGALVDDVLVVDSGSTDETASVAALAGARVVASPRRGKGEAMWHGLAATDADVVVFVDADLEDFDPRFVPALVGPLLSDSAIQFVKGSYDRPVDDASMAGGGRVTELMARPLIGAFWPELGGVLQPLAGEYAGRRALLERLPFRCGYGVDIGLLLDAYHDVGLEGLAQVDLYERHHRHSDLASLGRMAAEVMHTALDRLEAEGRVPVDLEISTALLQPQRFEGLIDIVRHDIDVTERPPLRYLLQEVGAQRFDHAAEPVLERHLGVTD